MLVAISRAFRSVLQESLPPSDFTRSQLTQKGPGKQRCKRCVATAEEAEKEELAAARAAAPTAQGGAVARLVAACNESSHQAKA